MDIKNQCSQYPIIMQSLTWFSFSDFKILHKKSKHVNPNKSKLKLFLISPFDIIWIKIFWGEEFGTILKNQNKPNLHNPYIKWAFTERKIWNICDTNLSSLWLKMWLWWKLKQVKTDNGWQVIAKLKLLLDLTHINFFRESFKKQ